MHSNTAMPILCRSSSGEARLPGCLQDLVLGGIDTVERGEVVIVEHFSHAHIFCYDFCFCCDFCSWNSRSRILHVCIRIRSGESLP